MKRLIQLLRSSIRGRLTFLVAAIAIPALLLVVLLVVQAYRNERRTVGQHLVATARAIATVVDQSIGQSESLLRGLAASRDLTTGEFAAFQVRAAERIADDEGWIILCDASGRPLTTSHPASIAFRLENIGLEGQRALAEGRTFVSNLVTNDGVPPLVYVVFPIRESGRLKFLLSHVVPPASIARALRTDLVLPGSVLAIMDRVGTIVARNPHGDRYTGMKAASDIVEGVTTRREGSHESVTLEGTPVLAVYSRATNTGWSVAMGVPFTALQSSARRLLWPGLGTSALLMLTAIFMAAWIGRALVRSVESLVADTEAIGAGRVPPLHPAGLAETDFVATAMRRTALRLKERDDENAALADALKEELELKRRSEESSRQLAAIVESSDDAIISKNLDGVVTSWNRAAERMFGYSADEMIGQPITRLMPPDRVHEGQRILERIRQGESVDHFETLRVRKDGGVLPISLTVSPVRDNTGKVVGASKISRDISQRRRVELQQQAMYELVARVHRAEALPEIYDAALDAMERCVESDRAAILLNDSSGVMRFVASRGLSETYRRAVEGHSPWARGDLAPQPVWIDDTATATVAPELRAALETEGIRALAFVPLTYEKRLLGKFMIYFDSPHCFSRPELRPVETVATQIAFAIERQRDAEALEALVNERTLSLRQMMAQMEEFSYSVSHDLRAPVRAMRGYAEIILQEHGWRLDNAARELLARIVRGGRRMDRMIQDLLTYSRISRRELKLEAVSLDKLVHEVVQQYPDMRPDKADIEVEGPLPDVMAHEPSLTQVISNLLSNAVKFVPPQGRPRVRVTADRRDTYARLWIADNGIGIKPEHHARLFGMFERFHPERDYEGTGIGLAIVRKAIERMNGQVGVESDGISGSRFWVELPIAPATKSIGTHADEAGGPTFTTAEPAALETAGG